MKIAYRNKDIEKVCTVAFVAERKYGTRMAEKIQQRIVQIIAADNVEELIQYGIGRCYPLHQNRKNQYAMDLVHPMRLVFEKIGDEIQIAKIIEITDYHR